MPFERITGDSEAQIRAECLQYQCNIREQTEVKHFGGIFVSRSMVMPPLPPYMLPCIDTNFKLVLECKVRTHEAFLRAEQQQARPKTRVITRQYHPGLAKEIFDEFKKYKRIVLKNPGGDNGNGVVVIQNTQQNLNIALKWLTKSIDHQSFLMKSSVFLREASQYANMLGAGTNLTKAFSDWDSFNRDQKIIIESYESNLAIMHEGKLYDPTMRVLFSITRNSGRVECHPILSYWKLPPQPIGAKCTLRQKTVSSKVNKAIPVCKVSSGDEAVVFEQLKSVMSAVFTDLLSQDLPTQYVSMPSHTPEEKAKKSEMFSRMGNALVSSGQFDLAEFYLKKAIEADKKYAMAYGQLGRLYYYTGIIRNR